ARTEYIHAFLLNDTPFAGFVLALFFLNLKPETLNKRGIKPRLQKIPNPVGGSLPRAMFFEP
ncbi:hypothetical protein, partial [Pseudoalteromonas sp. 69-MNA-CIBAN-0232]|uniref:hypothetical protein n=1 Tax=Pseudoalteromonas sp. 69-MNA-CIBAN-0232 TaxID=3140486 RepID=UPI00331943FC